jgi:hypothetical protein
MTDKMKMAEQSTTHPAITQEALAHLGDGQLAYVKPIRSEDVAKQFPQAPLLQPGLMLEPGTRGHERALNVRLK